MSRQLQFCKTTTPLFILQTTDYSRLPRTIAPYLSPEIQCEPRQNLKDQMLENTISCSNTTQSVHAAFSIALIQYFLAQYLQIFLQKIIFRGLNVTFCILSPFTDAGGSVFSKGNRVASLDNPTKEPVQIIMLPNDTKARFVRLEMKRKNAILKFREVEIFNGPLLGNSQN